MTSSVLDGEFEDLVNKIRNLRAYGQSLDQIHDMIVGQGISEEFFFLAFKAAEIVGGDHENHSSGR